ncbi:MAG: glycosyltransferase family 4 protein [Coriobacteriales bacterium]|jgi:glycosyltransferase involved in cell wall biosynthesis|nr:glycosyltransferase family 4 protein [Coriobacteriales bacterium]
MPLKLLYITYIDTQDVALSGSSVRALKMLEAFRSCGCEVMLLDGWNRKDKLRERDERVKALLMRLQTERPDACYCELPSGPLFCKRDITLLQELKRQGIPLALFYGDAYWRFPAFRDVEGTRDRRNLPAFLKDSLIYWMQRYDWRVYRKTTTRIYFPSASMAELFDAPAWGVSFPGTSPLVLEPPAARPVGATPTGIYVGGASPRYGTPLLLESFERANAEGNRANLILVCPEERWAQLPEKTRRLEGQPWLQRRTAYGAEQLAPLYQQADFACLPLRRNIYNDFAMAIKLFEYLSYHKPILATDCKEMAAFVASEDIGIVRKDTVESYADGIRQIAGDAQLRANLAARCAIVSEQNSWKARAQAILDDFADHCSS